ncbi:Glutamate 5-kinase [Oligella sp. MSHR50489EDL]|uniref:glutamate 5-kinase n=1 Tax=Oligella sp. MSHR50489EDL TaxID=3139409 RepID=UPI003D8126D5
MSDTHQTALVKDAKRVVIKIGSSLLTNNGKGIDSREIARWAQQIAYLHQTGQQVILVSSGAIAEGMARLGWAKRPKLVNQLQAAAAVGQIALAQAYETAFKEYGIQTAQVLLTHEDLADRHRYLNARSALNTLLELNVIPIINENDTVITKEIRLGDNDTLGALVANLLEAEAYVILTDQEGLYDSDPRKNKNAQFIHRAEAGDPSLEKMAGGAGTHVGTGGMLTKVLAAKRAARSGAHTIIANGHVENLLPRLSDGESIGTELLAKIPILSARKQWLAAHLHVNGYLVLDAGAINALTHLGKSLLPIGITEVRGDFERGDLVACIDKEGNEYARGLVSYSAEDARKIIGKSSSQIENILGAVTAIDMIHRDNMIIHH